MRKLFLFAGLSTALFLGSCTETTDETNNQETRVSKGGVAYGGTISINSTESYSSLFPLEITDAYSNLIANNVYEGLMRINKESLSVEECIAEKVTPNESADEFTFVIRKGVMFHDDACFQGGKGRELTAKDVEFCLVKACTKFENNRQADFLINKIEGANDFYNGKADKISGISVNGNEVKIKLTKPFAGFEKLLTHTGLSIYPQEAFDKYGKDMNEHMVGTGPFKQGSLKNGEAVTLVRNDNYWEKDEFGNVLPYADEIKISYLKNKIDEIKAFHEGSLDVLTGIPVEHIDDFVGSLKDAQAGKNKKHRYNSINGLNTDYVGFLGTHEVFNNVNVRKAFAYAIDRKTLVEVDLEGDASRAEHGFVPPMSDYESGDINPIPYDPEMAKSFLKKAGFSGSNFPEITLYFNNSKNMQEVVAKSIQRDLSRNLGIKVKLQPNSIKDHNEIVSNSKAPVWKLGWVADYPDAENFLNLFYGKNIQEGSYLNAFKFNNAEYDRLFEEASKEKDDAKRAALLKKCDQILVNEAAVLPLLHKDVELITAARIKNCNIDAMGNIDLKNSYIKERKK